MPGENGMNVYSDPLCKVWQREPTRGRLETVAVGNEDLWFLVQPGSRRRGNGVLECGR